MICPNLNCKSNIPDDSLFCPDCGCYLKNEEATRLEAAKIILSYSKGFNFYVKNDNSVLFSIANCEKIISKKAEIIKKHQELENTDKQTKEAIVESNYTRAASIVSMYNKGFNYYVRTGSLRNLTSLTSEEYVKKIIDWEDKIRIKHFELCPNDKHNIQNGSKFCSDRKIPVNDIEELRKKAKEITSQYNKAYNYFLTNVGSLPYITYNMTAEDCKKIISAKSELEKKQRELENEEKRKIDSSIHLEASNIYYLYTNAYNYFVSCGKLPPYKTTGGMTLEDCRKIISFKNEIIKKHQDETAYAQTLMQEASKISILYGKGFHYYVRNNTIPNIYHNMKPADSQKIISMKDVIIKKHKEIEANENKMPTNSGCLGLLITLFLSLNGGLLFIVWVLSNAL